MAYGLWATVTNGQRLVARVPSSMLLSNQTSQGAKLARIQPPGLTLGQFQPQGAARPELLERTNQRQIPSY
jgi:hypothetical protein